jgi:trigger factor
MSPSNVKDDQLEGQTEGAEQSGEGGEPAERPKLNLEVKIDKPSACERHVTVTVSREDIERYYKEAFDEMAPKAQLPGFRPGRAPRKLVESQFRDQVGDQVKGKILMESMTQISEEHEFSAISEPDFKYDTIEVPKDGPMVFEFDLEVRPEFDLPQWKGLQIERPTHTYSDDEVRQHLQRLLQRYGTSEETDEPIEAGDKVHLCMTFRRGDEVLNHAHETVEVRPTLSFVDAKLEGFDKLLIGKKKGDKVETKVKVSAEAENEALRDQEVDVILDIEAVHHVKLPELTEGFLDRIGGFADESELMNEVRKELERQLVYQQQRRVRQQISSMLTVAATWDLPPDLLKRQARRELERAVMELQSAGFGNDVINAHANELQRNAMASTAAALKEHFILERIAEEEKIDAEPEDYDREIELIAEQSDESPRRVRARMEKRGLMDTLRNQIVERKVIERITADAQIKDVPYDPPKNDVSAVQVAVGGQTEAHIPEAQHQEPGARPGTIEQR